MNKMGHRRREQDAFDERFAVGDSIIRYMRQHACSKAAACEHFAVGGSLGVRALKAALTTATVFPLSQRYSRVGYTKHQSLAEVSRKNLPFVCADSEYRRGLREALMEIARRDIPVNDLNGKGPDSAKSVLVRAIRRLRRRRLGADETNEPNEIRFPLVRGAQTITAEDVKRLEDEA
jgi:hypothetical protein